MATGDTIDVPIRPVSQQSPITSAALGELRMATNAIVRRYKRGDAEALKVSKRNGVHRLTATVRDPNLANPPVFQGASTTPMANATLMSTLADRQLVEVASENPFVFAQNLPSWERFDYQLPTQTLRQRHVFTDNNQMTIPDGAAIGDVYCYVWSRLESGAPGQPFAAFYDADGTPIRLPVAVGDHGTKIKVVADGSYFWIFTETTTPTGLIVANVYDTTGAFIASYGAAEIDISHSWDVIYSPQQGVNVTMSNGTNAVVIAVALNPGPVITVSSRTFATTRASIASMFCTNNTGDGFLYIATVDYLAYHDEVLGDLFQEAIYAYKLPSSGTTPTTSWLGPVVDGVQTGIAGTGINTPEQNVANIAGYAISGGALEVFIGVINTADPSLNYTKPVKCNADATRNGRLVKLGVSVASRAFTLGTLGVTTLYYASVQGTLIDGKVTVGQPTYFFVEMTSGDDQVCGRFEYGGAAMDYTALGVVFPASGNDYVGVGEYLFHLPSPFIDAEGGIHLPLCYRAETAFATQAVGVLVGQTGSGAIARVVSTVGLKDTIVGPRHGKAIDYGGEMFLPGPICTSFTGSSFSESGVNLAPEIPTLSADAGTSFLGAGVYSYQVVFEWTTPLGDRARSQPCAQVAITIGGSRRVTVTGKSLGMTSRKDVVISIYRTYNQNGVMSSVHAKVTNDLMPLFNDPTAPTWTFIDTMSDIACSVNEPLYSDPDPSGVSELFHDPAPAHSGGCVADNRTFLMGYDNYLWFSAEKTDGKSMWFNADAWRIPLPTDDPMVSVQPMDNRILIQCERSLWFVPLGQFPDATGLNGTIPTPQRLPFTNGATGYSLQTRDGVMYSSSAGDLWTIARDLSNVHTGSPIVDEMDGNAILGMSVNQDQRIQVILDNGITLVWDVVAQVWTRWQTPSAPILSVTFNGKWTYADAAGFTWQQDSTSFKDDGIINTFAAGQPIITTVDILPIHFGGVKNFKRVWDVFAYGQYKGDHDMHLRVTYDDEAVLTTVVPYDFTPDPGLPYLYSFRPKVEQCSSMAFKFFDSFPRGVPGDSFELEMLSFYVAIEKGLVRKPKVFRIPSGTPTYYVPGGSGSPGSALAEVIVTATVAAMEVFVLTGYVTGQTICVVEATGRMYYLAAMGTATADGTNVVTASDGREWIGV